MNEAAEFAAEYKKQASGKNINKLDICRQSFWEYEKYINPRFFREDRTHLKIIAITLQALYEKRIVKVNESDSWRIVSFEEKAELTKTIISEDGTEIIVKVPEEELFVCRNLMLNIPPRHGKSYSMSNFIDWLYGKNNENRVIAITYNDTLAARFSKNVRDGIDAEKKDSRFHIFSDVFPETKIKYGDSAVSMWSLEGQFFNYLGAGFGGTITGVGCTLGLIDDPVKNDKEAANDYFLSEQYTWYTDTFLSRIEEGGMQIIIMTRWSTQDLCGRLLSDEDSDDWYQLCMKACEDEVLKQMLCPELFSFNSYLKKKKKMSLSIFEANYNQEPFDVKGSLYTSFKTYSTLPLKEDGKVAFSQIKAYCDTADSGKDFLCSIVYGVYNMEAYVLDIIYTDEPMEKTEKKVAESYFNNQVNLADIESNNGGRGFARAVLNILKTAFKSNKTVIKPFHQSENKEARIISNSSWVMEHIYYPDNWMYRFPEYYKAMKKYKAKGKNDHDDAPDATTGIAEKITGNCKKARVGNKKKYGFY